MEAPWKKSAKGVESTPSSSSSSCFIANLPNPLLMEILCRVSIKTLTTSKSVCKSWLNLIRDPHFCQLHQRRSPTEVCFQPYHDSKGNTLELHLGNFNFPNNLDPCHFEIPKFSVRSRNILDYNVVNQKFNFANSCNGLLCYYGDPDYRFAVVWNPCTSEFITFPPSWPCRGYGLGFSRKENKFKLLRLMGGNNPSDMVVADICTIEKACSWKRIGPCSSHAWFRDYSYTGRDLHAVFLEGTLHWVGADSHRSRIAIHTFDFEDDHFGALPIPPYFDETYSEGALNDESLGVLGGCLFVTDYTKRGVTIWLMREYGVQDSWTKLFSLGSTIDKRLELKYILCLPIVYMDSGEILMKCIINFDTVIIYNLVQKSSRLIGVCLDSLRVIAYRPSLVPLKDSMLGYDVHVKPICAGLQQGEISTTRKWWRPMKSPLIPMKKSAQHGSKASLINDELPAAEVEKEREGHISGKGIIHISTTSAADLACQQGLKTHVNKDQWIAVKKSAQEHGSKAPLTNDELSGAEVEEEREGHVSGNGLIQISTTPAADLACQQGAKTPATTDEIHVSTTMDGRLERITTMMGEVLEELRKEREQRQELEERLRNELEPLKEQTEHLKLQSQQFEERLKQQTQQFEERLKQQTQQFEERLQDEHAKVEHLKQQNQRFEERLQAEHANVEHLKQQNQQFEERLQNEHAQVKQLEDR